jgi:hypothetical protein
MDATKPLVNEDLETMFTYQSDFLYPSQWWVYSNIDYTAYLVRRSGSKTMKLNDVEAKHVVDMQATKEWDAVTEQVDRVKVYLNSLDKRDRKLTEAREHCYWRSVKLPVR